MFVKASERFHGLVELKHPGESPDLRTSVAEVGIDSGHARTWPSLRLAPTESSSRLAGQGLRLRQQATRRQARPCPRSCEASRSGAGGMAPPATRAPLLTLWRTAQPDIRGVGCAPAPTWPEGPKEGSRRPACHGSLMASQLWADAAPHHSQRGRRAAISHDRRPGPARRARRALEDVEKVITTSDNTRCRRLPVGSFRW
jgi:hypothetical protein